MKWCGEAVVTAGAPKGHKRPPDGNVVSSDETNHLWFYKEVSQESVQQLVTALHETTIKVLKNTEAYNIDYGRRVDPPHLHLHIHSYGGELLAGFAAADAILSCPVPVHTHIEGGVASAATLFSIMGSHRTIGRNAFILIHQLSSMFWGKYEEFKDEMKNNDLLMKHIRGMYAERTKLTKAKIGQILKKDLWFDAATALKAGLVDEIR